MELFKRKLSGVNEKKESRSSYGLFCCIGQFTLGIISSLLPKRDGRLEIYGENVNFVAQSPSIDVAKTFIIKPVFPREVKLF